MKALTRCGGAVLLGLLMVGGAAAESDRLYTVKPGECLWSVAAVAIGDATLWPALYRANRDQIKYPRLVYPGQRLAIPAIDPATRAAVRHEASVLLAK